MKKALIATPLYLAIISSTIGGTPPSGLGTPIAQTEASGVGFKVFEKNGVRIVAVTPSGWTSPAFMSFVNMGGVFSESDVKEFLEGFASSTGASWKPLDRSVPTATLKFFLTAPLEDQVKMEKVLERSPNPEEVRQAWQRLASDDQARREAAQFVKMLDSQRQLWVADRGGYIATWSEDGRSIGVGILPIAP